MDNRSSSDADLPLRCCSSRSSSECSVIVMEPLTVVLLGHTGVGKSASGNTILGRAAFESKRSFRSVTTEVSRQEGQVGRWLLCVVDTPEILGHEETIGPLCEELLRGQTPVLFLVVIKVERYTEEQQKAVQAAVNIVGQRGRDKIFLLFTGEDSLENMTLEEFINEDPESPLALQVKQLQNRYHIFNNKCGGSRQVEELLDKCEQCCSVHPGAPGRTIFTPKFSLPAISEQQGSEGRLRELIRSYLDLAASSSRRDQKKKSNPKAGLRLVLLGLPGAGKSASGNTILGKTVFRSAKDFDPVTAKTMAHTAEVDGRSVTVVDTPGVSSQKLCPKTLFKEIMYTIELTAPGPHAFIIVVRIGRIDMADQEVFELLPKMFDKDAPKFTMVLFTHADGVSPERRQVLIQHEVIRKLLSKCGGRHCWFNNCQQNPSSQVKRLLDIVINMFKENGCYSPEQFNDVHMLPVTISIRWHDLRDWFIEKIEKIMAFRGGSSDNDEPKKPSCDVPYIPLI